MVTLAARFVSLRTAKVAPVSKPRLESCLTRYQKLLNHIDHSDGDALRDLLNTGAYEKVDLSLNSSTEQDASDLIDSGSGSDSGKSSHHHHDHDDDEDSHSRKNPSSSEGGSRLVERLAQGLLSPVHYLNTANRYSGIMEERKRFCMTLF